MLIEQNNLRKYRKQSQLTQIDVAHIMALADISNISHWELGYKKPNVEILLMYHLLFDIPIESLFDRMKDELKAIMRDRIAHVMVKLKDTSSDGKTSGRMAFLESVLIRLGA